MPHRAEEASRARVRQEEQVPCARHPDIAEAALLLELGEVAERPGMWEEADYCLRGSLQGYRYAIDRASFVWHVGNATMHNMKLDVGGAFLENRTKYLRKWHNALTLIGKEMVRVNKEVGKIDPQLPVRIALQKAFAP